MSKTTETPAPKGTIVKDPEVAAISRISNLLGALTPASRRRVVLYFQSKELDAQEQSGAAN